MNAKHVVIVVFGQSEASHGARNITHHTHEHDLGLSSSYATNYSRCGHNTSQVLIQPRISLHQLDCLEPLEGSEVLVGDLRALDGTLFHQALSH